MIGEIIRLRNGRSYSPSGNAWSEFKHPDKSKVLVAVVIGIEDKVNPDANNEHYQKMIEDLGYKLVDKVVESRTG